MGVRVFESELKLHGARIVRWIVGGVRLSLYALMDSLRCGIHDDGRDGFAMLSHKWEEYSLRLLLVFKVFYLLVNTLPDLPRHRATT